MRCRVEIEDLAEFRTLFETLLPGDWFKAPHSYGVWMKVEQVIHAGSDFPMNAVRVTDGQFSRIKGAATVVPLRVEATAAKIYANGKKAWTDIRSELLTDIDGEEK